MTNTSRPKGGDLARLAGIWCGDPSFQTWLGVATADEARAAICKTCDIDSRSKLDHDVDAAERFHESFRKPYRDHLKATA